MMVGVDISSMRAFASRMHSAGPESADHDVRRAHELLLGGPRGLGGLGDDGRPSSVRGLVAESWVRSVAAGVDADHTTPPLVFESEELSDFRAEHALSAIFPLLYDVLGRAAEDCDFVMAVGDAEGRLLWVCGRPSVVRRAEHIGFVEGTWWDEPHAGTNAPGTAIQLDAPVQIRAAEHFALAVQPWSCAAAPIHDPETRRILGVVDITGGTDAASPQSLAMVRSAARMAEAELGRLLVVRRASRGAVPEQPLDVLRVAALGRPDCEVSLDGRTLRLSQRHSDILALLADAPAGLSGEQLALEVYGAEVPSSTVRAEIVRLRSLLGRDAITSRPYRLTIAVSGDWLDVEHDLASGLVRSALRSYAGPLLPQSGAPGIVARRDRLERSLRDAVIAANELDLLVGWTRSRWGLDDLEAWERQVDKLPASSPLRPVSQSEVLRLRAEYGLDPSTGRLSR